MIRQLDEKLLQGVAGGATVTTQAPVKGQVVDVLKFNGGKVIEDGGNNGMEAIKDIFDVSNWGQFKKEFDKHGVL